MAFDTSTLAPLSTRGITTCRGCHASNLVSILDLALQPLANELAASAFAPDSRFPLHLRICDVCALGQVGEYVLPERIFGDYPYLSSVSASWVAHARDYAVRLHRELDLRESDLVVEIASNDGYLLREFLALGVRVVGVEPAETVASIARASGVDTVSVFFGLEQSISLASNYGTPRLVAANNVLAHVPDLDDFVGGLSALCGDDTVITVENPSFATLLRDTLFDTIYHEHFSYLSAHAVQILMRRHGLELIRVEALTTHGGSYRYWIAREGQREPEESVEATIGEELSNGLMSPSLWRDFARRSRTTIEGLQEWIAVRAVGDSRLAAYGAAAKGNTLLNAANVTSADISLVADGSAQKQGKFLPGSRIPVVAPQEFGRFEPSDVLILPWNIAPEITQLVADLAPEARCWIAVPSMTLLATS